MNFSLPHDIADRIQAQFATGHFTSEVQVLREALEALERRQTSLAKLRSMVDEAEAEVQAGQIGTFDVDDIVRDVRRRLAENGVTD
jgi:putative addiction module CopG family antidote